MPIGTSIEDIQVATQEDTHLEKLQTYIIQDWLHKEEEVEHSISQYWPLRNEMAMIDGITMKCKKK